MSYPLRRQYTLEKPQKLTAQILQLQGNEKDPFGGGGTCFGDSGGPAFHGGYVVGDTSYGYTSNCRYLGGYQRVDIPIVRSWLTWVRRFEESLAVMRKLWTEADVSFAGKFWQFEGINIAPKPVQKPHPPIWFGARQPTALRRAVKFGDAFMGAGSSSNADFVSQVQQIRQFLEEERRDPATLKLSKRVYLAIDEDRARAEARLREWFGYHYGQPEMGSRVSIWGSKAECLDKLGELVQAGAQHLLLNPVFDEMAHLELLVEEVVPFV
jgi:alkanesulfonate monooxygenase SsuD/methylene tetrahydromethanopterin reductase-like flavin-dependent oxidoreductase (luciferase family)